METKKTTIICSSTNLKTGRMKIDARFEDETVWLS